MGAVREPRLSELRDGRMRNMHMVAGMTLTSKTTPPLSDRLAALTGPDREIEAAVTELLWPQPESVGGWVAPNGHQFSFPPHWTSDLNVVVAEIERRGLGWRAESGLETGYFATIFQGGIAVKQRDVMAPTPCLALLRALVNCIEVGTSV